MPRTKPVFAKLEYLEPFGRSVRVAEFDRPMMSDDVETAQTVSMMDELATRDAGDRAVIDATHEALEDAGLDMTATPFEKACAVFWYLKRKIRYVPTPGTSPLVDQTLVPPSTLLQMPDPWGDCPQFSMAAKAMLQVCCVPTMFKTIAAEPEFPNTYSHIYNVVDIGGGKFMPFDSSNGPSPGAEYAQPFKRRIWLPTIPDRCKETNMQRTQPTAVRRGFRSSTLRGTLGDAADDAFALDGFDTSVMTVDPGTVFAPGWGGSIPTTTTSSGSTTGFLTTLVNDATAVAAPIVKAATNQAPQWITNPTTGQSVLYNPTTGTTVGATGSLSSLSPTMLLIGGGLLLALMMSGKK